MGVDTIQINLVKSVDAVKLQAGVPKWLTNVENVFDGLGQLVGFILVQGHHNYFKSDLML